MIDAPFGVMQHNQAIVHMTSNFQQWFTIIITK